MRVLPISNYNPTSGIKKNKKLEAPTVETVQNADTVSFKSDYAKVFREGLQKDIITFDAYKRLFAELTRSVRALPHVLISKKVRQWTPEDFYEAYHHYKDTFISTEENPDSVIFKTAEGTPLLVASYGSITFYPVENDFKPNACRPYNGDYIEFNRNDKLDYKLLIPGKFITLWYSTGNLKEEVHNRSGMVSYAKYYNEDGTPNGWKNFFFGVGV